MNPIFYLLLAHFVADYAWQSDFMAKAKADNLLILMTHCLIWTFAVGAALTYTGLYASWQLWWLFFGHFAMDFLKSRGYIGHMCEAFYFLMFPDRRPRMSEAPYKGWMNDPVRLPLWIDQLWHIFQLAVCVIGFAFFSWTGS